MQTTPSPIAWDPSTKMNFDMILEQIPMMIRGIAESRVSKKAEALVRADNRVSIFEKDMVDAFFAETPAGFLPPMKSRMEELGINYRQYGYE